MEEPVLTKVVSDFEMVIGIGTTGGFDSLPDDVSCGDRVIGRLPTKVVSGLDTVVGTDVMMGTCPPRESLLLVGLLSEPCDGVSLPAWLGKPRLMESDTDTGMIGLEPSDWVDVDPFDSGRLESDNPMSLVDP